MPYNTGLNKRQNHPKTGVVYLIQAYSQPTKGFDVELMTERRAAEVLLVNRSTLAKWRKAGIAPKHLVLNGKSIRYRMEDLMDFVNESYNDEESEAAHV